MTTEARREYLRKYRQQNRETLLAKQRERSKAKYRANPEASIARTREWARKNPERAAELQREYRARNRETLRVRNREHYRNSPRSQAKNRAMKLKTFGLTPEQYAAMLADQGGVCAICQRPCTSKKSGTLHVDHCHATGLVRGLLCHRCNAGLGMFQDDPQRLQDAVAYLARSSSGATST